MAQRTGLAKSSVHRLTQAMERRAVHPESWLWETEEGRQWLTRLVVATLYTFGLKRGVGLDTMSEFFARLRLEKQVGCSPSALRKLHAGVGGRAAGDSRTLGKGRGSGWRGARDYWGRGRNLLGADDPRLPGCAHGVHRARSGGRRSDLRHMESVVDARLTALGTEVLYLVSDRAKALIQLAEQG